MPELKQNEIFAGRYLLNQLIGEGGFSEVWKASDLMADHAELAIKIYAPNKGMDDESLLQSRNEFSLTHNLSHPHLLKVNHFDVADGFPYLIMTYCPFGSLVRRLKKEGIFNERQVALVMCQIGAALEEIHRQVPPIIHQDIKPDNILLLHPEYFMLADFGISSRIRHTISRTSLDRQALTIAYAPPERFDVHPGSLPASDIFSLGVTLYEMCTNTVPWDGAGGQCLLKGARVPALPNNFSPELSRILEACMSADPAKRPTATEIYIKGNRFLKTGQWQEPKKKSFLQGKRALISSLAAASITLLAVAGPGYFKFQRSDLMLRPHEKATVTVVKSENAGNSEDKPKTKAPQLSKAKQEPGQQKQRRGASATKREAQPVKTQETQPKKTDALAASQKSRAKPKSTYSKKSVKAKKPSVKRKTKSKKKWKPKMKWLKKLKRRLGS